MDCQKGNPAMGAWILREPKGVPDCILFSDVQREQLVKTAADILSVQGYTARRVCYADAQRFHEQTAAYQSQLIDQTLPLRFSLGDCPEPGVICLPVQTEATALARIVREAIFAAAAK